MGREKIEKEIIYLKVSPSAGLHYYMIWELAPISPMSLKRKMIHFNCIFKDRNIFARLSDTQEEFGCIPGCH